MCVSRRSHSSEIVISITICYRFHKEVILPFGSCNPSILELSMNFLCCFASSVSCAYVSHSNCSGFCVCVFRICRVAQRPDIAHRYRHYICCVYSVHCIQTTESVVLSMLLLFVAIPKECGLQYRIWDSWKENINLTAD